jgi:hypothetical protein
MSHATSTGFLAPTVSTIDPRGAVIAFSAAYRATDAPSCVVSSPERASDLTPHQRRAGDSKPARARNRVRRRLAIEREVGTGFRVENGQHVTRHRDQLYREVVKSTTTWV